jgi:hypothetical protein
VAPLLAGGVLAVAAWWALAAALLPVLVRGRTPALDLVAATTWAAALAAGTQAIAQALPWPGSPPQVRGLVLGAVAAGLAAVVAASWSRVDDSGPTHP